jgi:DNA-binding MarR family transcriptional regulator
MENVYLTSETYSLLIQLLMQSKHQMQAAAEKYDLSPIQAQALMMLGSQQLTMSNIGRSLACDASNVTGIVDRLETAHMIERRSDEADRRVKLVALSPLGLRTREEIMEQATIAETKRVGPVLNTAELETLNGLLKKLVERSAN